MSSAGPASWPDPAGGPASGRSPRSACPADEAFATVATVEGCFRIGCFDLLVLLRLDFSLWIDL